MKLKFTVPNSVKAGMSVTVPETLKARIVALLNRGIAYVEVNEEGHLLFTMTDGAVEDLGKVTGDDGISVTHEWDGTVLRVTSASGTSEADLKGDPLTFDDLTDEQREELRGADGESPTVTIEPIENGHRVTITDKNGEQSFDIFNGEDIKGDMEEILIMDQEEYFALPTKNPTTLYLLRG